MKSEEAQGVAIVYPVRELLTRQRTQAIMALRGHLSAFELIVPQGAANAVRLVAIVDDPDSGLPADAAVTLVGGRVTREACLRNLGAWARASDYRLYQLRPMPNVSLFTESNLDAEGIVDFGADHVLLGAGAGAGAGRSRLDPVPGFESAALTQDDLLDGRAP